MSKNVDLSIANMSCLTQKDEFLLQVSTSSKEVTKFIEDKIPDKQRSWLVDLKSWRIKIKWLLKISELCLSNYDQVFLIVLMNFWTLMILITTRFLGKR